MSRELATNRMSEVLELLYETLVSARGYEGVTAPELEEVCRNVVAAVATGCPGWTCRGEIFSALVVEGKPQLGMGR